MFESSIREIIKCQFGASTVFKFFSLNEDLPFFPFNTKYFKYSRGLKDRLYLMIYKTTNVNLIFQFSFKKRQIEFKTYHNYIKYTNHASVKLC